MLGTIVGYSCRNNWTAPSDKDVVGYEWAILGTTGTDPTGNGFPTTETEAISVRNGPVTSYLYVRSKNRSGIFSAWATDGVNLNTLHLQPAGSMMLQDKGTVDITGGAAELDSAHAESLIVAPLTASNPRANLAIFAGTEAVTFSGGSPTTTLDLDITNRGFTAKPDWGLIQVYDTNFLGVYDYDTASTTVNARFVIFSRDGGNLSGGFRRYHFILGKY
jgi:hypothetical protein